jgi:hypothetical protein
MAAEGAGTKDRPRATALAGTRAEKFTPAGATVRSEATTWALATTAGDPCPTTSAEGAIVHSKEDNRKRKPTATISPCFTYLCVKTTGRCKMFFSKETILSSNPTKKVSRLDNRFPLRLRLGKITFRTTCQVKTKMSINSKRTFCAILFISFIFSCESMRMKVEVDSEEMLKQAVRSPHPHEVLYHRPKHVHCKKRQRIHDNDQGEQKRAKSKTFYFQ